MICENYRSLGSILMKNRVSPTHQIHMKNVYREGKDSNGNDIHVYICWHLWIPVWIQRSKEKMSQKRLKVS